jgi:hypothetical protein
MSLYHGNGVNVKRFLGFLRDFFDFYKKCGYFFEKKKKPGDDLLSHSVARAVSSALKSLTSGFGMGPGVSSSLWSPGILHTSYQCCSIRSVGPIKLNKLYD